MEVIDDKIKTSPADGRETKGAAMRTRLRTATVELIGEIGIDAATVIKVAKRCNVSRGAVLHHYPRRNDLIIDAAKHFWRSRHDILGALADDLSEGRVDLPVFIRRFYDDVFASRSILTMLELVVEGRNDTEIGSSVSQILSELFRAYENLGSLALHRHGLSSEQVSEVMALIVSTLRGLRLQQMIDPGHDRSEAVLRLLSSSVEAVLTGGVGDAAGQQGEIE